MRRDARRQGAAVRGRQPARRVRRGALARGRRRARRSGRARAARRRRARRRGGPAAFRPRRFRGPRRRAHRRGAARRRCRCRRQHPRHHRQRRRAHGTERAAGRTAHQRRHLPPGARRVRPERQAPIEVKGLGQPVVTHLVRRAEPRAIAAPARAHRGARDADGRPRRRARRAAARVRAPRAAIAPASSSRWSARRGSARAACSTSSRPGSGRGRTPAWCSARGLSRRHSGQPFGLLRDLLAARFGLDDADSMAATKRRLESGVVPLFEADEGRETAAAHAHLLGQLLGLDFADSPHVRGIVDDGRQIRGRGLLAATQLVHRLARQRERRWCCGSTTCTGPTTARSISSSSCARGGRGATADPGAGPAGACRAPGRLGRPRAGPRDHRIELRPLGDAPSRRLADALLQRSPTCRPICANSISGAPTAIRSTWRSSSRCSSTRASSRPASGLAADARAAARPPCRRR